MSAPRRARVLAAYATVKVLDPIDGKPSVRGFYQGAVLPIEADPENVASLVRREYAEWLDKDGAELLVKQETDTDKAVEVAAEQRRAEGEAAAKQADDEWASTPEGVAAADKAEADAKAAEQKPARPDGRPDGRASQATWLAYAVSQRPEGMSEDDARTAYGDKTKAELVAEFGN